MHFVRKLFTSTSHHEVEHHAQKIITKSPFSTFRSATDALDEDEYLASGTKVSEPLSPPPVQEQLSFAPAPSPRAKSLEQPQDPVDDLLDSDNLSSLLRDGEDTFIESLVTLLSQLIQRLIREVVMDLVPVSITDEEEKKQYYEKLKYKFPYMVTEIFTCEIGTSYLLPKIAENKELLKELYYSLERDYFSPHLLRYLIKVTRVMSKACKLENTLMLFFYDEDGKIVLAFVKHIGSTEELCEYVLQVLTWEPEDDVAQPELKTKIDLVKEKAVCKLLDLLLCEDTCEHAFALLNNILSFPRPSVVVNEIIKKGHWENIFAKMKELTNRPEVFSEVIEFCNSMIINSQQGDECVQVLLQNLKNMADMLREPNNLSPVITVFGSIDPPLGVYRLKLIEFFVIIIKHYSELTQVHTELDFKTPIVESGILPLCIELFFAYPHHNILHHFVTHIVTCVLENNPDHEFLREILFSECKFIERIVQAFYDNTELFKKSRQTLGYMGHLTLFENFIANMDSPERKEQIEAIPGWKEVAEILKEKNYIEYVYKIGGSISLPKSYVQRREAEEQALTAQVTAQ